MQFSQLYSILVEFTLFSVKIWRIVGIKWEIDVTKPLWLEEDERKQMEGAKMNEREKKIVRAKGKKKRVGGGE